MNKKLRDKRRSDLKMYEKLLLGENGKYREYVKEENGQIKVCSQEDIILSIIDGNDTLAILPTGSGKSICFQLAGLVFDGITIVITPLIALIKDQVQTFNNINFTDERNNNHPDLMFKAIYPSMNNLSADGLFDEIINPQIPLTKYKFLYISPERLNNPKFIRNFWKRINDGTLKVSQIVIDEAHCFSQWGYDFRSSYFTIPEFIKTFAKRPVISGFTATATKRDINLISSLLNFKESFRLFSFLSTRNNLKLNIINVPADLSPDGIYDKKLEMTISLLNKNPDKRCVIYCTTVIQTNKLQASLQQYLSADDAANKKRKAYVYTGKLNPGQRYRQWNSYISNRENIMVATKAFGMGIDLPDIELVIHFDMPLSIEDYYQEVGRGGRNQDLTANCYLLYCEGSLSYFTLGSFYYNIGWIMGSNSTSDAESIQPLLQSFTPSIKNDTNFWKYYRLIKMWELCRYGNHNPDKEINSYFNNSSIDYAILKTFEGFLTKQIDKDVFSRKDVSKYWCQILDEVGSFNSYNPANEAQSLKEIKLLIKKPLYLHVNNTKLANLLRWHPEAYPEYGKYNSMVTREYKQKRINTTSNFLSQTEISDSVAFIHIRKDFSSAEELDYINDCYLQRKSKVKADLIITVKRGYLTEHLYKRNENTNKWEMTTDNTLLSRYVNPNRNISHLIPKSSHPDWYFGVNKEKTEHEIKWENQHISYDQLFVYLSPRQTQSILWRIEGNERLNYFDLCVADAIYSLEVQKSHFIRVQNIWQLLSGDFDITFSRGDSRAKILIEESIEKMRRLEIEIINKAENLVFKGAFLPLQKEEGEGYYRYSSIPPLYEYAEESSGELSRIPVTLLKVKDNPYLSTRQKASASWVIINHFLLHRIAIAKRASRGDYIRFDTLQNILSFTLRTKPQSSSSQSTALSGRLTENFSEFIRQLCEALKFYKESGYLQEYCLYKRDFDFEYADGKTEKATLYVKTDTDFEVISEKQLTPHTIKLISKLKYKDFDGIKINKD